MNSVAVRGRPMTTGAHEVTTVDKLQHLVLLGGGEGMRKLDSQVSHENYITSRHNHLLASVPVLAVIILAVVGKPNTKDYASSSPLVVQSVQCCYILIIH